MDTEFDDLYAAKISECSKQIIKLMYSFTNGLSNGLSNEDNENFKFMCHVLQNTVAIMFHFLECKTEVTKEPLIEYFLQDLRKTLMQDDVLKSYNPNND